MRTWLALGLALMVSVPAMAMAGQDGAGQAGAGPDGGSGQKPHVVFPMPATAFSAKITTREQHARERMEREAATLPADKAKELRANFDRGVVRVNVEVARVSADGTVTKDEAKEVRKVAHEAGIHLGHGHHRKA